MNIYEYILLFILYFIISIIKKNVISLELAKRIKTMEGNLDRSLRMGEEKGSIKGLAHEIHSLVDLIKLG